MWACDNKDKNCDLPLLMTLDTIGIKTVAATPRNRLNKISYLCQGSWCWCIGLSGKKSLHIENLYVLDSQWFSYLPLL